MCYHKVNMYIHTYVYTWIPVCSERRAMGLAFDAAVTSFGNRGSIGLNRWCPKLDNVFYSLIDPLQRAAFCQSYFVMGISL